MPRLIFILGGARSGKSRYALNLAKKFKAGNVAFIATASCGDDEMRRRIREHKRKRPRNWLTIEEPKSLVPALKRIPRKTELVIIDCLTLLVSNLMLGGSSDDFIEREIKASLKFLKKANLSAIIVSNEVGLGIVPDNPAARRFRDVAGRVNQIAAQMSDEAYFVISGLALKMKGDR